MERKKPGPKVVGEPRDRGLTLRLRKGEIEELKQRAAERNMTVTTYLCRALELAQPKRHECKRFVCEECGKEKP